MEQISSKEYMVNYGLITSVVLVTFSLMLFFLEAHYEQGTVEQMTNTVIIFAGITLGCLAYKKANDNIIQGSTVRKIGTGISLIIALVSLFYQLFLTNVLDPAYWDIVLEIAYNQTLNDNPESLNGLDLNGFIEASKPYVGYFVYPAIILGTIFFGFIYSVVLSLFIKTKKQL